MLDRILKGMIKRMTKEMTGNVVIAIKLMNRNQIKQKKVNWRMNVQ